MGKTFAAGLLFVAAAIATMVVGTALNLKIESVFFGLTIGAVLAFVSDKSGAPGRLGGFAVGIVVTMAGYLLRILLLNESLIGQILFAVIVALLITLICALTGGRLPLWSALLGAALVAGSYEASFLAAPQDIETQLLSNVSAALVPAAIAFLAGIFMKPGVVGVESKEDEGVDQLLGGHGDDKKTDSEQTDAADTADEQTQNPATKSEV